MKNLLKFILALVLTTQMTARAGRIDIRSMGQGADWVHLRDGAVIPQTDRAATGLSSRALASADFDEDGMPDLITGYGTPDSGGSLSIQRGNIDAIYPNSPEAQARRQRGEFTASPLFPGTMSLTVPEAADFVGAGDFDADGHWDIVTARNGGDKLYWFRGDGHGGFAEPKIISLPGAITSLITGEMNRADGLTDVAVGIVTQEGPRVLVFESPEGALRGTPESFPLPAAANALALGQLDADRIPDLAVASGNEIMIIHGRDRKLSLGTEQRADVKSAEVSRTALDSVVLAIVAGDFVGDSGQELAALSADGRVRIFERDGSDAMQLHSSEGMAVSVATGAVLPTRLLVAKVSSLPKDDLLVFGGNNAVQVLTTAATAATAKNLTRAGSAKMSVAASLTSESELAAVLPMRLNADALQGLVLLTRNDAASLLVISQTAATFVVNIEGTTNDQIPGDGVCADVNGKCSFNAALQEANAHPGADTINFNIPGGGTHTLSHGSQQYFNEAVTIDGTTQPNGKIEIVANGEYPVVFFGGNSVLRGVAVYGSDVAIIFASNGNIVEGNYVGFRADGTKPVGFGSSGSGITFRGGVNGSLRGDNNLIGGTTSQARNVISNCTLALNLSDSIGTILRGNYIGTNVAGTAAFSNATPFTSFGGDVTIGGTTAGAGNLISGNGSTATLLIQASTALIQGNLIGTTADGSQPIANSGIGIDVNSIGKVVTIGGTTPAARNVIAANAGGIFIRQDDTAGSSELVQGNFIGTNAAGTGALPNLANGILTGGATHVTIGGTATGAGNLISGNGEDGIRVAGGSNNTPSSAVIQGNLIGTDVNGVVAIPNTSDGIELPSSNGTLIGGTSAGARNVISGNHENGIRMGFGAASSQIQGNYIGLNRFGTGALGNNGAGMFFDNFTGLGDTVGGTASGSSNNIAFNGGAGVATDNGYPVIAAVVANSIHDNGGLGIDLSNNGVTKNTTGSGSNFPVITSVQSSDTGTTIQGTLQNGNYTAGITYTLQFFSNSKLDPSGYGEGETYIGQTTITTDGTTAPHPFSLTVTPAVPPGRYITAVASGKDQFNQAGYEYLSEFSFAAKVAGPATPQNTPLRVNLVTPQLGGNNGSATTTIIGEGISQGATVVLRRAGQPDIVGENVIVSADGSSMTARFNLNGRDLGSWDVVVTNANGATTVFAGGYTVEAGRGAQLWTDVLGRPVIRVNRVERFTVVFGNRGNTDAYMVPIWIAGIPKNAKVTLGFTLGKVPIPAVPGAVDPNQISPIIATATEQMLPVIIPVMRAGAVKTFQFTIEVPTPNNNPAPDFVLRAWSAAPLVKSITQTVVSNRGNSAEALDGNDNIVTSDEGITCVNALFQAAVSCALSLVPGADCAKSLVAYTSNTVALNTGGDDALGWSQFSGGALQLFMNCALKEVPGLSQLLDLVNCGASFYGASNTCRDGIEKRYPIMPVASRDPNDKVGSVGIGAPRFITGVDPFRYSIYFENVETATAPAQQVVITDQLDVAKLDLATFELGAISFGKSTVVTPPPGLSEWTTDVDLRPAQNLLVRIIAALEKTTGVVTWRFISLDPATRQPTDDPLAGFLPPDKTSPEGDGVVVFSVKPKTGQPDGTQIQNKARIVFDANAPIDTPTWFNTIDNSAPESHVLPLAAQSSPRVQVSWTGSDTGAGINAYTIYVSRNGGPFVVWLSGTTLTTAFYDADPGATYEFYSVAYDGAGNRENPPVAGDANITVPTGQLLNIATRLRVQSGENVLIGGFIITGTGSKKVMIRGIGPSLAQFFSGPLSDPTLELFQGNTSLASNNDWKESQAEIEATGIPPTNDKESAIVRTLAPGSYTAVLRGNAGATGIGVVEVYDLDQNSNSKLANIASRGFVDTDNNIMIGGLIVGSSGGASAKVVVRAIGPSLGNFGIAGALQDPTLDLVNANGVILRSNNDWQESEEAAITATGLQPGDIRESVLVAILAPGNYTAIVRGAGNTTGVGLVEVYNLQ